MVKKFSKEYLMDVLGLPYENYIVNQIYETGRWENFHKLIFEDEGKFWKTTYAVGATEMQDSGPWDYEDQVKCTEVHQVEKLIKVWEAV